MTVPKNAAFNQQQIAFLRQLANDGCGVKEAAEIAQCGRATVAKYAGDILAHNRKAAEKARHAAMLRMVKANASAICSSDRDEIAARFGMANRKSLKVRVVYAKRKLGLYDAEARA